MPEPKIEVGSEVTGAGLDASIERACDARYFVDIDEGSVVLDYLSLQGRLAARLAEGGANVVCAVGEAHEAKEMVDALGLGEAKPIHLVCCSPERLPFRDSAFDCAFDVAAHAGAVSRSGTAAELVRVLGDSGALVCGRLGEGKFGTPSGSVLKETIAAAASEGNRSVGTYAVIPSARDPRAYLPLDGVNPVSTYTRFFSERFFSAESLRSKVLRWLAMRPSLGGVLVRFVPSRLMVATAGQGEGVGAERPLREAARTADLDVFLLSGVWRGADVPSTAAFIGFKKGRREPSAIAKVSRNPTHNEAVDDEFDRMASIRDKVGPAAADSIPKPLVRGRVHRSRAAVYEWAGGDALSHLLKTAKPKERMGVFEEAFGRAVDFLGEAFRHTCVEMRDPTLPLGARDATARQVVDLAASENRLGLTDPEVGRLKEIAAEGLGGVSCLSHGDFAPCNVQIDGAKIWVLDWELAAEGRTPMFDLATFLAHSFEDIAPADRGAGLLTEAFRGELRALPAGVHETISGTLSAFGVDGTAWKRFFPVYCASEMLRDLLYFRLGTAPVWGTALRASLELA